MPFSFLSHFGTTNASTTEHKCQNYDEHHRRVSGLAVIKLFFENVKFSENYLFEMLKFKEIPREREKYKKIDGN